MSTPLSEEEKILYAVKRTLTEVIKDTATSPGMKHPLSENTIHGLRDCLVMISQREQALAEAAGRPTTDRPHFRDEEPTSAPRGDVVVPINAIGRSRKR